MNLENDVTRKYLETKDASDWEIKTDTGWEDLKTVSKTIKYEVWEIKTKTKSLKCADNHILFYDDFKQVFCKDIEIGERIITKDGLEEVISVENLGFEEEMYDLDISNAFKRFYTNDILSHNSTVIGLFCLWNTIFAPKEKPVEIWVLSNKGSSAQSFLEDIKGTYEELDPYIKSNAGVVEWNKTSVEFENGSKIKTGTTSKDTIRGESPTFLVLDEFAHVPFHIAEEFYTAVEPTISTGGKMVIISTPNGNSGKFYDLYAHAGETSKGSENGFARFEMDWNEPPGRDEDFKKERIKRTSLQQWNQEYEAKFLGSSDTLINANALERIGKLIEEPNYEYENFLLWEKPKKDNLYIISCDVAKGVQKDSSVIQIINVTNSALAKQAGVWSSNEIDPFDFSEKINEIGRLFNDAFVIIENNTYGHEVGRRLFDEFQYENIYKERKQKHWGIYSDKRKKSLGTSFLRKYLEDNMLHVKDSGTYEELCNFVEISPDIYGCPKGKNNHDDKVMSLVWAAVFFLETDYWKEWSEYLRNELTGKNNDDEKNISNIYEPIICDQLDKPVYDEDGFREDGWILV